MVHFLPLLRTPVPLIDLDILASIRWRGSLATRCFDLMLRLGLRAPMRLSADEILERRNRGSSIRHKSSYVSTFYDAREFTEHVATNIMAPRG